MKIYFSSLWQRKWLRICTYISLSFVGLLILLFTSLQIPAVQGQLSQTLSQLLSDDETQISISPIEGFLPFSVRFDEFSLADKHGVWLKLEKAELAWSFSALLSGELLIEELGGKRLLITRLPPSKETVEEEPLEIPTSLPDLDFDLMRVNIHHLGIDDIHLGKAVLGQELRLNFTAHAETIDKQIKAQLQLKRVDQDNLKLNFDAHLHLKPLRLELNLQANETGGLLAALSGQPDLKNLHLELVAGGLLNDWQADLNAQVDGVGRLNTILKLGIDKKQPWLNLSTQAELEKKGILPQHIIDVIGTQQAINLQVIALDSENLQVKQLSFKNDLLTLNTQLDFNLAEQNIKAKTNLKIAQLHKLNELSGLKLSGHSELNVTVTGTLEKPNVELKLALDNLKVDDLKLSHLETNIEIATLETLETGAFKIGLQGLLNDLTQQGKPLPESNLTWKGQVLTDDKQQIDVKNLQIDGDWSHIKLAGIFDSLKQQGDFNLQLNLDNLKAVTDAANANINTSAKIKIHPKLAKIEIALNSNIQKLTGLAEPVSSLLGQTIKLSSNIEMRPENSVLIKNLKLKAKGISVNATTALNLKNQQLKAKVDLSIPNLNTKDLKLQHANAQINITGTTAKPNVVAVVNLAKMEVAAQKFNAIKLKVSAKDVIDNLHGQLQLNLSQHGQPLALKTAYALQKQQFKLNKLILNAPKTKLTGQVSVDLNTTLAQGKIVGNTDLSALKPWTGQALKGNLKLNAAFKPQKQQQQAHLSAQLNQLEVAELKVKAINLEVKVENALKNPLLKADLSLEKLKQQQTSVEKLTLNVAGLLSQLQLKLAMQGKHQEPFAVNLLALLKHDDKQTQFQIQKLTGSVAKQKLKLSEPSTVSLAGKKITLSPLALSIGSAKLEGQLDYSPQKIRGQLKLALPLSFANQFAELPLKGNLDSKIEISGTAKQPDIMLAVNLSDLKLKDFEFKKFPATQLKLTAELKQQHLNAELKINNSQFKKPVQAQIQTAVKLQLEPFLFDMPEQELLKGQITAALDLAKTTKNLPLNGQQVKGDFNINLNVSGTVKEPQLQGNINLKNGEYQNSLTETYFKAIQLNIDAQPKQITLTELSLKDDDEGGLKVTGLVSLDAAADYPFHAQLNFNHTQLANSPELKTHLSGDLKLKGNTQKALLSGLLNIDDFKLTIPSPSGQADIPEMEVIEIGGNRASAKQQLKEKKAKAKKELKLALDIGVKIANKFYIKGYGLDSEWKGDLSIKGMANMPKVLGKVQTKRGSLEVLNNRFVFRQGLIDFNGAFPPLPSLNINAVAETDTGEAAIQISGMADNPQLKLTHAPNLPQDEIISSLLFGQDVKSVSPMQALQLAEVVKMLAAGGLSSLDTIGSLQSGLGLDRLNIGGDDFDTASVKAGKYVTDKIYLEVEQGLQSESSTATVEIDLLPDIKAEIEFNQQSDSSVGIKWKHDY